MMDLECGWLDFENRETAFNSCHIAGIVKQRTALLRWEVSTGSYK